MEREKVVCGKHGDAMWATFVCRHIAKGTAKRFLSDEEPTEAEPWPDAYCDTCEAFRLANGGEWNDQSEEFADVTILCNGCYEERRASLSAATQA